ncbi:hypothetical protein EDC01DRAFT_509331 [Geopyxis carbonaria]|nr:hypothetical protein EDC01DRAFT_509331 [Geopyxis carbonaria]
MSSSSSSSSTTSTIRPFPQLPFYILLEVLQQLPGRDLLTASAVCKHWHTLIHTRRRLRDHAFLPPSAPADPTYTPDQAELHPIFSLLHFSAAQKPEFATYGVRADALLADHDVRNAMASSPPLCELKLELLKYHEHMVVRNPAGVRVSDVMAALPKYITGTTDFTFEEFYARDVCRAKGFNRVKRMRRSDMIGHEKVLLTFSAADGRDPTLFRAESFVGVKAARQAALAGEPAPAGYRFWGAFAYQAV